MIITSEVYAEMADRRAIFAMALEELFREYPLQGNPENPRKMRGIKRVKRERYLQLSRLRDSYYIASAAIRKDGGQPLRRLSNVCRVPHARVLAIHTLLFPD